MQDAAAAGSAAFAELRTYLAEDYAADADDADGVGAERYAAHARWHLVGSLDPAEAYDWAWHELRRIRADRDATATAVLPGATFAEAHHHLVSGGGPTADGADAYRGWLQERTDETIEWIDGLHVDLPPALRRCEVVLAPPGVSLAAYYTAPSKDFRVPGRTWWPTGTRTRFALWDELTTCYHEAVPGHHLQIGWSRLLGDRLPSCQRFTDSGGAFIEGWALYAERLMDEFGRFEEPAFRLGFLASQSLRAARVIVDIGMHLGMRIPDDAWFQPGEQWTANLAIAFLQAETGLPSEVVVSEIVRYLGWPGQAISYKLGERAIMAGRDAARARRGADFDLKAFNAATLDLGVIGLDLFQDVLSKL
jgi:uncharacterized protein (DUF885 family)